MKLENVISKNIVALKSTTSISECAKVMKEKDIGFIPLFEDNKIVGVITDRDITVKALANKADIHDEVKKYMTKKIYYLDIKDKDKIFDYLSEVKVKRLFITDNKKVIGICSYADLIKLDDKDGFIKMLENILEINRNDGRYEAEIDEFYL